ncbi:MAG: Uma2 family endonuclease [Planctomycetes bacterium]|nr:Uma2 family endonuclease [Planctomycetota bacterium]
MSAVVLDESIRIPGKAASLEAFRRWARSRDFPTRGRYSYLRNEVWADMSAEELYTHNRVKGKITSVLTMLLENVRLGQFFHDRVLVTHVEVGLSTEPDATFVSFDAFKTGRVRRVRGAEGYVELVGSVDMTLEVVSASSVHKDTVYLRELYWDAGVREYWLIDARRGSLSFQVLRHTKRGYVASRSRAGWVDSAVFGRAFKLTVRPDEIGDPEYRLAVR